MIELLKIWAPRLTPAQKVIGLLFDEVFTKYEIAYDAQEDRILGPHRKVNWMCVRSLINLQNKNEGFNYNSHLPIAR